MKFKEGWILLLMFIVLLVPPLIVIISEVSDIPSHSAITKYKYQGTHTPIRFQLIGDYGDLDSDTPVNNSEPVRVVSQSMQLRAKQYPISFIISVGDNSYPHSSGYFDQTIYKLMYKVFDISYLSAKPWYLILGNHDCEVNSQYEIHSSKLYPMWNMPTNYYNFSISIDNYRYVGYSFLDGCILLGSDQEAISNQYAWLKTVLADQMSNPNITWKVVSVHMPLWSPGDGHGDNEALKQSLFPILIEFKVDLILTGHEHIMAHYVSRIINGQPEPYEKLPDINYTCYSEEYAPYNRDSDWMQGEGIHQVLQGAGGRELYKVCPNKTTDMADLMYANAAFGFNEIYIDSNKIEILYFDITQTMPVFTVRIFNNTNFI